MGECFTIHCLPCSASLSKHHRSITPTCFPLCTPFSQQIPVGCHVGHSLFHREWKIQPYHQRDRQVQEWALVEWLVKWLVRCSFLSLRCSIECTTAPEKHRYRWFPLYPNRNTDHHLSHRPVSLCHHVSLGYHGTGMHKTCTLVDILPLGLEGVQQAVQ
jgi:hypothetical protein